MAEFKLVLGLKNGKCAQRVVKDEEAKAFLGLKLGDKISGDKIGLAGYEFEICGGSDYCGFPMRKDLPGSGRKRVLITRGVGMNQKGAGLRKRKTVCGNAIHAKISQINLKVLKEGKMKLVEEAAEEKKEGAAEESKKADKKEESKTDKTKKTEKKEDSAAEKTKKTEKKEDSGTEKPKKVDRKEGGAAEKPKNSKESAQGENK
ncbi:MAG: 30S ribosomal protein S6e [Candidatus Woesearchaeota archaeon]